jgi:hypothetical protein
VGQVLLDTNLLILWIAGETELRIIGAHKRLQIFREADYRLICRFIEQNGSQILILHVTTEAANLLAQIGGPFKMALRRTIRKLTNEHPEIPVSSAAAVAPAEFLRLGLTDAAILTGAGKDTTLLTRDLDLYIAAQKRGILATNFEHLRDDTL